MRVKAEELTRAAEAIMAATALCQSWRDPLQSLAAAAGAKSAAVSRAVNSQLYLLGSNEFDEPLSLVTQGKAPRFSDAVLISPEHASGFCSDADPKLRERFSREPFFRDFMCQEIDIPWRASAQLHGSSGPTGTYITVWRSAGQGAYDTSELALLQSILPSVRMASVFARQSLERLPNEQASSFERRGEAVFRLGIDGRVTELNSQAEATLGDPLTMRQGRLVTTFSSDQREVDRVIGLAVCGTPQPGMVSLSRRDGARWLLLILPVIGQAREAFGVTQALAVLIDPSRREHKDTQAVRALQSAIQLTCRECDVVLEISAGQSPVAAAARLKMSEGTARNHLKSAMQKAGVHTQVELAALVARLA